MDFGAITHKAYDHLDARKNAESRHGTQAGDPVKGARAMYELATMENPPLRCAIGTDAYGQMLKKVETYDKEVKKFEKLTNSTDVDK